MQTPTCETVHCVVAHVVQPVLVVHVWVVVAMAEETTATPNTKPSTSDFHMLYAPSPFWGDIRERQCSRHSYEETDCRRIRKTVFAIHVNG